MDERGLDNNDRRMLHAIIGSFGGGPVGLDTLAAAIGEEKDNIEDVYEPYLIQIGFIQRTPRGRGNLVMPMSICKYHIKRERLETSDFYYELPKELIAQYLRHGGMNLY